MKLNVEIKNNSVHHSNLLKPFIKCHIYDVFPGFAVIPEKRNPLRDSKSKASCLAHAPCTVTTGLPRIRVRNGISV